MTTAAAVQFIYFDLGNVLLAFDHEIACAQIGELTSLPAATVREILFDSGLQESYERGERTSREIYDEFCRRSGTVPASDAFHHANSDIFSLNVPIVPIVGQLAAAGHRLGILSNTCEDHWEHITSGRFGMISYYFRVVVLSYRLRSSKPGAEIYRAAAEAAGAEPQEIFFVDDRQENVDGTCEAGFDAVLYRGPHALAAELRQRGVRFNY